MKILVELIFRIVLKTFKHIVDKEKNQVHTRSLHAEENAFLRISKTGGTGVEGGFLFTSASPCELCSKKAYQLGMKKIFYIDLYPGISQKHILECGSYPPMLELFTGAIGRAYHQLYEPILPYKDELKVRLEDSWPAPLDDDITLISDETEEFIKSKEIELHQANMLKELAEHLKLKMKDRKQKK